VDNTPIVSGGGRAGRIVAIYNMNSQPFIDDGGQVYMYCARPPQGRGGFGERPPWVFVPQLAPGSFAKQG